MLNNFLTIKEAAQAAGITERAMYMHYHRGNIERAEIKAHRVYFERAKVEDFIRNFYPNK